MTTKKIIGALLICAFVVGVIIVLAQKPAPSVDQNTLPTDSQTVPQDQTGTTTETDTKTDTGTTTVSSGYSMIEVVKHNSDASCWTAINGNVYDLTDWIGAHPGGDDAIRALCGKDGTSMFMGKHGGDPRAQGMLSSYKIGALAK